VLESGPRASVWITLAAPAVPLGALTIGGASDNQNVAAGSLPSGVQIMSMFHQPVPECGDEVILSTRNVSGAVKFNAYVDPPRGRLACSHFLNRSYPCARCRRNRPSLTLRRRRTNDSQSDTQDAQRETEECSSPTALILVLGEATNRRVIRVPCAA